MKYLFLPLILVGTCSLLSMDPDIKHELLAKARKRIPLILNHLPSDKLDINTHLTLQNIHHQETISQIEQLTTRLDVLEKPFEKIA